MKQGDLVVDFSQTHNSSAAAIFGQFQLWGADGNEIVISNRRARALLAMLCLAKDEPINRDFLSKLLWAGRFEAHAKASLRQCLLDLGKLLAPCGPDILVATRSSVALRPHSISTDLDALEQSFARADYAAAAAQLAAIGTKPIVDQMDFGDAFNAWVARHSGDAEKRLRRAVEIALACLEESSDDTAREHLANAWSLRGSAAAAAAAASPHSSRTRIAVLPFQSVGARDEHDYFADGMVDELITTLGQVPQLLVAGRTSSFHFRGSDLATPAIANELRVAHLIEGSVQRWGSQVRIFVRLIDGATGFESWGHRYDGSLDDIFVLQEAIAQAVTAALAGQLGLTIDVPQPRAVTGSKAAYDLYLQGRALGARIFGEGVLDNAVHFLEQALEIDPLFAEAWVELAEAHHNVAVYTQCRDRMAAAQRMADCARRAIELAPQLGYPHALLGTYEWTQNNVVGALDLVFKAYRLQPDHPGVAMRVAAFLLYCGCTTDAVPYVKAALDQDPVDPRKYALMWAVHFGRGEFDEALRSAQRVVDLGWPSTYLAFTSAAMGRNELAVEQYQLTKRLVNTMILPPVGSAAISDEAMDAYWLVGAKGICGGQEADRQIYAQVLEMMYATLHDKADMAISGPAIFMGNPELVFKTFGHHLTPANILSLIVLWADVDPIRRVWQHPEFIPFAQRIGMAAAWDKYGWPDLLSPPSNCAQG